MFFILFQSLQGLIVILTAHNGGSPGNLRRRVEEEPRG